MHGRFDRNPHTAVVRPQIGLEGPLIVPLQKKGGLQGKGVGLVVQVVQGLIILGFAGGVGFGSQFVGNLGIGVDVAVEVVIIVLLVLPIVILGGGALADFCVPQESQAYRLD